jgi:CDP-paratose 2-epimerase
MTGTNPAVPPGRPPPLGICQWFHYEAYEDVERAVALLRELDVRHLRTGISWADYHRPGGKAWYDWQMSALDAAGLDVLLSVWHTPPSLGEAPRCAAPPRRLADYAEFIGQVIIEYGDTFGAIELWNEPNNLYKWDFASFDPDWRKFATMVDGAARAAHAFGKQTVLGGMMPVDPAWLALMERHGALEAIDVVAIHGFPRMWWDDAPSWDDADRWQGWPHKVASIAAGAGGRPVWVSETGFATWDREQGRPALHAQQVRMLEAAVHAPAERVYWYSLVDLHPDREAIEGFHVDEHEYHLGLVTFDGTKKPAYARLREVMGARSGGRCGGVSVDADATVAVAGPDASD